ALTVRRLGWSLGITAGAMIIEFVGGILTGSVALVSDAGHMLTHAFALGIAVAGILVARMPACHHRTFGLLRVEHWLADRFDVRESTLQVTWAEAAEADIERDESVLADAPAES
ncbi:MAG: cation transporter, partial [Planctomycetota bacterium]